MAIREITKNGKTVFQVYVQRMDKLGRRVQRRKDCASWQIAKRVENELNAELRGLREKPVNASWEDWVTYALDKLGSSRHPNTMKNYFSQIPKWVTPYWRGREIGSITKSDVEEILFEVMSKDLADRTRKTVLGLIRVVFGVAVDEGVLVRNPTTGVKIKVAEKEKKVLTPKEVEILLEAAKKANHPFYEIWALALFTGLRSGELFALRVSDVDLDSGLIHVTKQWTKRGGEGPTKTRTVRKVSISKELSRLLGQDLKVRTRPGSDFLLSHPREWCSGEQSQLLRDFCRTLGITQVRFHDLRATFITNLLAQGVSTPQVMKTVGHTQLKTTNVYLRLSGVEIKGVTEALSYSLPEQKIEGNVVPLRRK